GLVAWRREWALPAIGLVLFASALSLSWVMPWYLAWSLPFAALARPRALVPGAVLTCRWLGAAGAPRMAALVHAGRREALRPPRAGSGRAKQVFWTGLGR